MFNNLDNTMKNLATWAKDTKVNSSNYCYPATSWVVYQPLGVVLIIGAWNFPAWTLFNPLISAIAAGNLAVIKPSEAAVKCSESIRKMIEKLDQWFFWVVTGGPEIGKKLT